MSGHEPLLDNPLIAAYQAGRLCNQMYWHMQQAVLLCCRFDEPFFEKRQQSHSRIIGDLFGEFCVLAPDLDLQNTELIRDAVMEIEHSWNVIWIPDEDLCAKIRDVNDEYMQDPYQDDPERWTYRVLHGESERKQLVDTHVKKFIELLRAAFKEHLSRAAWRAFELGEFVDQGIHRRDVHRYMTWCAEWPVLPNKLYEYSYPDNTDDEGKPLGGIVYPYLSSDPDFDASDPEAEFQGKGLVTCDRQPGRIAPDKCWSTELNKALMRMKLPHDMQVGFAIYRRDFRDDQGKAVLTRPKLLECVDEIDAQVRRALIVKANVNLPQVNPRWDEATTDRNRWLYDQFNNTGVPEKKIISELERICEITGWLKITSVSGCKKAANAYAKHIGANPIPSRKGGRPPTEKK